MTVLSAIVWAIAYRFLPIENSVLHGFVVVVLIAASILPLVLACLIAVAIKDAVEKRLKRRSQKSALATGQSSTEGEIDPLIFLRIQALNKIKATVDKHLETLARRRLMLVTVDHYGIADGSAWNKEVQRFVDKVVRPELTEREAWMIAPEMNEIFQVMIEDRVRARADEIEAELKFSSELTPIEFEQWCARTLNSKGWKAITTKASGDQGADVIAEKEGVRIILQCKLYSGTVGNKAVQEAYSAQRHYATDASAVVTNSDFSPSARTLANTTGVLLLHYGDLTRLDGLLSGRMAANTASGSGSLQPAPRQ